MIKPLRKRHRVMWGVLWLVIAILFVRSYRSPDAYPPKSTGYAAGAPDFVESVTAANDRYSARLGTLRSGEKILQLDLKVFFGSPAPAVYLAPEENSDVADYRLLGEINAIGNHQFKFHTPGDHYQLIVYDPIKKTKLETFNFQ